MATIDELERALGAGVRAHRVARQLTRAELAELANVSLGALRNLETGRGSTTTTLVKALRALDAEQWLTTLTPPSAPFDPLALLTQREQERHRRPGPSRVRHRRAPAP